jgi:alpha-beta hydrolase superfamily lysophospholipase
MGPDERTYTAGDGTELPMRVWPPPKKVPGTFLARPAALVYLHGIQSHSGWYEASSRRLAEAGVAVYQIERRGSGRDAQHERGHVDKAETWLEDVARAAELARDETGAGSVHLMGISWGGKLAMACAAHRPDLYRSLILSAPGIVPIVDVAVTIKVRIAKCLMMGEELRRFPIPIDDPHLFTENPDRVRYIAEDELSLRDLTARFMYESRRLDPMVRAAAATVRVPTLLLLAERDRIINNEATRALIYSMAARKRVITYPGAHHTLEFELDPQPYFKDLVAWIDQVEGESP